MYKKWKSVTALSMAALLGCLMPMGTMLAAEENTEVVQESEADSVSDSDECHDGDAGAGENENGGDEINADAEDTGDEVDAGDEENADNEADVDNEDSGDEVITYDESMNGEADADSNEDAGTEGMSEGEDTEAAEDNNASVIDITLNGVSCKVDGLGGKIDYIYVNNLDQMLDVSVSPDYKNVSLYYYLDKFDDITADAKDEGQMASLWPDGASSPTTYVLSQNKNYVLYVKAVVKDGPTIYARSGGIVVDTIAPEIVGLVEGNTYPEGTAFKVNDANLDSVKVNETIVTPESDGSYLVSANGTSCVISAKDKAGNESTCSITVTAKDPEEEEEKNEEISASGTYSLKAGTSYKLAEGKWQVDGDSTIYQGGSTFYIKTDGDYSFTKS